MLDCHSPNEDMFLHFCRQMVQICPYLCCFLSILKTTPNISSLASFYSSRRKCTERLGASLYALITFRATSNAIQGRILKFLSGCGEGRQKIVSEYDQEIPQSQTADNPVAPRGRATQPS